MELDGNGRDRTGRSGMQDVTTPDVAADGGSRAAKQVEFYEWRSESSGRGRLGVVGVVGLDSGCAKQRRVRLRATGGVPVRPKALIPLAHWHIGTLAH
jgi:hypothetical protein